MPDPQLRQPVRQSGDSSYDIAVMIPKSDEVQRFEWAWGELGAPAFRLPETMRPCYETTCGTLSVLVVEIADQGPTIVCRWPRSCGAPTIHRYLS